MKTFVKRTLLFTVLVLCLFAISVLAASAAPTGSTSEDDTSAAYFMFNDAPYFYASFEAALSDAIDNGVTEVVLLKDAFASSNSAIKVESGKALTIKGAEGANITLTVTATSGISVAGELTFENLTLSFDKLDPALKCYNESVISFKNSVLRPKQSYPFSGTTDASHTFEFVNSTIDFDGTTADTTYLIYHEGIGTLHIVADGLATEISLAKFTSTNSTFHANLNKVTKLGATIAGLNIGNPKKTFENDATAKVFGYNYRVTETEGGVPDVAYFTTCAEAFAAATTVWNISGSVAVPVDRETYNPDIDFQNDGEAKSALYCFRIGETEGGDRDVTYFNDIVKAVEAVPDGGKIYVIGSMVVSSSECRLNKSVSFIAIGLEEGQFYSISKAKENSTNFFVVSEANPVTVKFENIFFSTTAVQGYLFSVEGAGTADITLKNGGLSFANGGIRVQGNASAKITLEGGEYTAYTLFNFTGNASVELNVTGGAVLAGTGSVSDSAIIFVDTAGDVKINLKDIEMKNSAEDCSAIWLMKTSTVDLTMENVYIKVKSFCITSDDTVVARVNLSNVTFISTELTPVRLRGAKGSYTNIFSGMFISEANASAFNSINGFAIVNFGGNMSANFYDGYFSSEVAPLISALNTTVTINIYGGTYACTSVDGTTSPISLPSACTLNIYGGTFRNASRVSPVFSNVTDSRGSLTLHSYHAYGNANLIVNLGKGTASALHTGIASSSLNTIMTTRGATPVFNGNTITGLGFQATVSADTLQYFQNIALEGAVNFGMLIVPTSMLTDGTTFSHYGLSSSGLVLGEDFFKVDASAANIQVLGDGSIIITLNYTGIAQEDFNTAYSVVFYADLVDAESEAPFFFYSAYDKAENSRSVAQVANVAYNDSANSYTAEQLAALADACGGDTAQKTLDIFLVAGGSNAVGNTPYSNNFANAFDQSAISANVFYSSMISERATQIYGKNTVRYMASQYTAIGATPSLDLGWAQGTMGFEVGMAQKLSELYTAGSDRYAAIIKFAANDATLAGADATDAGSWSNLYGTFIAMLSKQIADYTSLGYKVNVVGMYWMQGEKDVAQVAAYESALTALITNTREDLSDITGTDLSDMPVVIGEIATFLNLKTSDAHTAFVAAQNELASTENNVIVDPTSLYMADANGVFTTPSELVSIGVRVAATLIKNGTSTIDPATVEIPGVEFVADIIVTGSEPTSVTSIAMALAVAPVGSTIELKVDLDLQATINIDGINGITLNGNGKTISVNFDETAFTLKNSSIVFNNIKLAHNGANVGFKLDNDAKLLITGADTDVVTTLTAFELSGKNSQLIIENGSFKTVNNTAGAIIYTDNGDVEIKGGTFEAAVDTSCVVVDRNAPTRLAVNVEGGSFTTTTSGATKPAAFVNECPVAILAIAPTVVIDAGATINNGISK